MQLMSGNIFIRRPNAPMKAGEQVLSHRHEFDHTTFVQRGAFEVCLLKPSLVNFEGNPLNAEIAFSRVIRATDDINWLLILKGRFHLLTALEDGSVYQCVYSHRIPQALTEEPGGRPQLPYTRRDADGVLWVRVDETIVQDTACWEESYR